MTFQQNQKLLPEMESDKIKSVVEIHRYQLTLTARVEDSVILSVKFAWETPPWLSAMQV